MKNIFSYRLNTLSLSQTMRRPLSILLSTLMFLSLALNLHAQCPSPAATTAPITSNNTTAGTSTVAGGAVTYVTGNITYGTASNTQSFDIQSGGTLVISAGSHFTVSNLSIPAGATLILQAGATVSVVSITGFNGNLNVSGGGIVKMCENTGIESCGTTAFTSATSGTYAVAYVGAASGKAVVKATVKGSAAGSGLVSSASGPFTTSPNITVAMAPLSSTFSMIAGSNLGAAYPYTIGSTNCTTLPFTVTATCGEFAGFTASSAAGTIDCNKTQLATAPVFGTASQLDLIVTVNTTTAGTFDPLSISGSGMSIANGITYVTTTTTGSQQLHIPVKYDGTALGTMNYTIGAAGTCAANLALTPKSVITKVWTLDNCTPTQVGPKLK
jgi:hypothetical protein